MKLTKLAVAGLLSAVLLGVACGKPAAPPKKDDKSAPVEGEVVVTPPAMAGFIKAYVAMKTKGGDEFLSVRDEKTQTDVRLKLAPFETAEMTPMGMGIYYSCAPMEDASGGKWDVDFIASKTNRGMFITELIVHKTPTETRHEWVKNEREIWEKHPL